jgi:hypothetical protein
MPAPHGQLLCVFTATKQLGPEFGWFAVVYHFSDDKNSSRQIAFPSLGIKPIPCVKFPRHMRLWFNTIQA